MALPLVGALPAIITGIGTAVAFIVKFIKEFLNGIVLKLITFGFMTFLNSVILSIVVLYYYLVIDLVLDIYGLIDQFLDYLTFKNTNLEVANMVRDMLGASLFFQALKDSLNIFKPILSTVFVSVAYIICTKALLAFRNSVLALVIAKI